MNIACEHSKRDLVVVLVFLKYMPWGGGKEYPKPALCTTLLLPEKKTKAHFPYSPKFSYTKFKSIIHGLDRENGDLILGVCYEIRDTMEIFS